MLCTEIKISLRRIGCYIGSRGCWLLVEADAMAAHISIPKLFASGDATEWFKRFKISMERCDKGCQVANVTGRGSACNLAWTQ